MRALVCVAALGLLAAPAMAAELPQWAYPVAPPAGAPPDNTVQKSLAGSTQKDTEAPIKARFRPPPGYPEGPRPMPDTGAPGQKRNAVSGALWHPPHAQGAQ